MFDTKNPVNMREHRLRDQALRHPIRELIHTNNLTSAKDVCDLLGISRDDARRHITILKRAKLLKP